MKKKHAANRKNSTPQERRKHLREAVAHLPWLPVIHLAIVALNTIHQILNP